MSTGGNPEPPFVYPHKLHIVSYEFTSAEVSTIANNFGFLITHDDKGTEVEAAKVANENLKAIEPFRMPDSYLSAFVVRS